MNIANFYPGPSRVYSNIPEYFYEAYMSGILGANHRSVECMELVAETKEILKKKLLIPRDYEIAFTSSATENWEIIAQSLTGKGSFHFFNGAFGEKWFDYAGQITKAERKTFSINETLPVVNVGDDHDVICITQNETSNGTQVLRARIKKLREDQPNHLIAVDATSSLGGIRLDFEKADYWFASVQKCLGLPSGMGLVILSPRAVERAYEINERAHYNSLVNILDNTRKNQTQHTPNVLGIFLLNRTQQASKGIEYLEDKCTKRMEVYDQLVADLDGFDYLVKGKKNRSATVLAIRHPHPEALRKEAKDTGIVLGAGYGQWKPTTFRIANFPAIKTKEVEKLTTYLRGRFA